MRIERGKQQDNNRWRDGSISAASEEGLHRCTDKRRPARGGEV